MGVSGINKVETTSTDPNVDIQSTSTWESGQVGKKSESPAKTDSPKTNPAPVAPPVPSVATKPSDVVPAAVPVVPRDIGGTKSPQMLDMLKAALAHLPPRVPAKTPEQTAQVQAKIDKIIKQYEDEDSRGTARTVFGTFNGPSANASATLNGMRVTLQQKTGSISFDDAVAVLNQIESMKMEKGSLGDGKKVGDWTASAERLFQVPTEKQNAAYDEASKNRDFARTVVINNPGLFSGIKELLNNRASASNKAEPNQRFQGLPNNFGRQSVDPGFFQPNNRALSDLPKVAMRIPASNDLYNVNPETRKITMAANLYNSSSGMYDKIHNEGGKEHLVRKDGPNSDGYVQFDPVQNTYTMEVKNSPTAMRSVLAVLEDSAHAVQATTRSSQGVLDRQGERTFYDKATASNPYLGPPPDIKINVSSNNFKGPNSYSGPAPKIEISTSSNNLNPDQARNYYKGNGTA